MTVGTLNRKTLVFLVVGVLAILVLRYGLYRPPAVVAPVDSIPAAEMRLENMRRQAATVPGREAVLKKAMADLEVREKGILKAATAEQARAQLMEVVHKAGAANGFDARGADTLPQPKPLGKDYGEVSVVESFSGGIEQLVNFLASLANEPEIVATSEIHITGGNDKKKNIQVRLNLSGVVPRKLVPEKKGTVGF